MPDALAEALHELAAQVAELRQAIAPELAERAAALAALRGTFAEAAFTATDALEAAAARPGGELAAALLPMMGDPRGGVRRLSRRLAKLTGKGAAGLVLARIGDDRGSALYVIQRGPMARLGRPALRVAG